MEANELEVLSLMESGNFKDALAKGMKLHKLGNDKVYISRGLEAIKNPDFYIQLKKNPDDLVYQGLVALRSRLDRSKKPKPS